MDHALDNDAHEAGVSQVVETSESSGQAGSDRGIRSKQPIFEDRRLGHCTIFGSCSAGVRSSEVN
jgi:hypothetical protein